jgi:uncharacterized protein (DUF4415 family)
MSVNKSSTEGGLIDTDDAPELTQDWFDRGSVHHNGKLISRGRPLGSGKKTPLTIGFDDDVLAAFRARGKGWQTMMNDALRDWLKGHP